MVEEGQCVQGKDFNFQLTGFSLSGKVGGLALTPGGGELRSNPDASGPEGVTVHLRGKNLNVPARATITARHGHYSFHNVMPGDYELTATHSSWSFAKASLHFYLMHGMCFLGLNLPAFSPNTRPN